MNAPVVFLDGRVALYIGDCIAMLDAMEADSVDCVVTSPPYWRLRDYGVDGQIGLEPTLGDHLDIMVRVFDAVRRVLKPTGTCFINYGDCYATSPNGRSAADTKAHGADDRTFRDKPFSTIGPISGARYAPRYGTFDKEGSGFQGRGSSFESHGDGRTDTASIRTSDIDVDRALELTREPLTQILENMRSLLGHLPSGDYSGRTKLQQSSSAMLGQVPAAVQSLDVLRAALASTTPESSEQRQAGSLLSGMISACLSSLRSFEICARRFVDKLDEPEETPRCTDGIASPSEELAHHIQCTVACCSLLLSSADIKPERPAGPMLKAKDLCMVPNRLAIALQEAGWWVRSEIVWAKPNPMPESIRDRPATSHEKIFMLTKSARYWYDAKAVRQPSAEASVDRGNQDVEGQEGSHRANGGAKTNGTMKAVGGPRKKQQQTADSAAAAGGSSGRRMAGFNDRWDAKEKIRASDVASPRHAGQINHTGIEDTMRGFGRNLRNYEPAPTEVWNIATQPFSDAHFATFPPELAERCILAGCPKSGLVLDPFGGAGTTALVALRHQRRAALIELNPAYAEMAQKRIESEWRVPQKAKAVDHGPLFAGEAA